MRPIPFLRRLFAAGLLVSSTSTAALVPLADAIAERNAGTAVAHVEDAGSSGCALAHDHATCQFCRVLRLGGAPSHAPLAEVVAQAPSAPLVAVRGDGVSTRLSPSAAPRAPPILS